MIFLPSPLRALLYIKLKIQTGLSTRESIREYARENVDCHFAQSLMLWLFQIESNQEVDMEPFEKHHRKMMTEVLKRGLEGDQILKSLELLEEEMVEASYGDIDRQTQKLPFILMIPLFILQLPAFLLLIFGNILFQLTQHF